MTTDQSRGFLSVWRQPYLLASESDRVWQLFVHDTFTIVYKTLVSEKPTRPILYTELSKIFVGYTLISDA